MDCFHVEKVTEVVRNNQKQIKYLYSKGGSGSELCVAKCIASLSATECTSWYIDPKTNESIPVYPTETFVQKSVTKVFDLYREMFTYLSRCSNFSVTTCVIGAGSMVIPYLCHTMNALYLPSQFMLSYQTIQDVQTVIDCSDIPACAVASTTEKIAYIKLMQIPSLYKQLLKLFGITTVLFVNHTESEEAYFMITPQCKDTSLHWKCDHSFRDYNQGEIYLKNSTLEETKLINLKQATSTTACMIPAAETAMGNKQIQQFAHAIHKQGKVTTMYQLQASSIQELNVFASGLMFRLHQKQNATEFTLVLNPYFSCHPWFEEVTCCVPICYRDETGDEPHAIHSTIYSLMESLYNRANPQKSMVNLEQCSSFWIKMTKEHLKGRNFKIWTNKLSIYGELFSKPIPIRDTVPKNRLSANERSELEKFVEGDSEVEITEKLYRSMFLAWDVNRRYDREPLTVQDVTVILTNALRYQENNNLIKLMEFDY